MIRRILPWAALLLGSCGGSARSPEVSARERAEIADQVEAFVAWALAPAKVAPPSVSWERRVAEAGPVRATVVPIRPEEAAWNAWPDGTARLFNNRRALTFYARIEADGPVAWRPRSTYVELNDPGIRLPAFESAERLLLELTWWAYMQERALLDGDLAERTRAAGPFRGAYLPYADDAGVLEGLVAFDLSDPDDPTRDLADRHVVALRLTLTVETPSGEHRLVWTFD